MIGIGFFSVGSTYVAPSATWAYTQIQGGFAYGFSDGKTYHLGGYGVGYGTYYNLAVEISATNIVGSWSSMTITLGGVVWTGNATGFTLNLRQLPKGGASGSETSTDTILTSTTMSNGATSVSITLTGSALQNYLNGTTSSRLYLEWNPAYYAYYLGFSTITITLS